MFLTKDDLSELTGRIQRSAQIKQLIFMGIEHRIRADGSIAVLTAHVDKEFGAGDTKYLRAKAIEPNWAAI